MHARQGPLPPSIAHIATPPQDLGLDTNNFANRVYATRAAQPCTWVTRCEKAPTHQQALSGHVDTVDVVALICLQEAKEGGLSSWASSISVYNAMLQQRPDLVGALMQPLYVDRKGEVQLHV